MCDRWPIRMPLGILRQFLLPVKQHCMAVNLGDLGYFEAFGIYFRYFVLCCGLVTQMLLSTHSTGTNHLSEMCSFCFLSRQEWFNQSWCFRENGSFDAGHPECGEAGTGKIKSLRPALVLSDLCWQDHIRHASHQRAWEREPFAQKVSEAFALWRSAFEHCGWGILRNMSIFK